MRPLIRRGGLPLVALAWLAVARPAFCQNAQLQKQINQAIDKGVAFLKAGQANNGTWKKGPHTPGATALAAWTLLECGLPANDPAIQNATFFLRNAAVAERKTYHLSLYILFFDKLGDPEDSPLIESLAVRLLASQTKDGGWTYDCEEVSEVEQKRLQAVNANRKNNGIVIPPRPVLPRKFADLDPAIRQQIQQLPNRKLPANHPALIGGGDNSNTHFAMVAVWVSARYGVPANPALQQVSRRFAAFQRADGSWLYQNLPARVNPPRGLFSDSMSCAGLLGLAMGVNKNNPQAGAQLQNDAQVAAGFKNLAGIMQRRPLQWNNWNDEFHFLWSLGRVGMAYGRDKIQNVNWFELGTNFLVMTQADNGSWTGKFAVGGCDTCFALLFLKRANGLDDLTAILQPAAVKGKQGPGGPPMGGK
jgi:hypothetical protein